MNSFGRLMTVEDLAKVLNVKKKLDSRGRIYKKKFLILRSEISCDSEKRNLKTGFSKTRLKSKKIDT